MLSSSACSLVGRLIIGHQAMVAYIFRQENIFWVRNEVNREKLPGRHLCNWSLGELGSDDHRSQLKHSSSIFLVTCGSDEGPLDYLRCTADFVGNSNNAGVECFHLPLGGVWIYNVPSSTIVSQPDRPPDALSQNDQHNKMLDIYPTLYACSPNLKQRWIENLPWGRSMTVRSSTT